MHRRRLARLLWPCSHPYAPTVVRVRLGPSLGRGAPRFREERGDELRGFDGPIAALHHRRDDCAGGVGWWWGVKAQTVAMTAGAE